MRITSERSREIFKKPKPPGEIWEKQFDYFDDELKQLAKTDWKEIKDEDLWYYFHDMAYVELQPELFNYLFPVCLNYWYRSLMENQAAARGDAEFHYSLHQGQIFEKMTTPDQTEAIYQFFHDGLIDRIEQERGFQYHGQLTPAYAWMFRFNSIGYIAPIIDRIWSSWWNLDHPGKAVSAIMYGTGFVYLRGENPIFGEWTCKNGGGGPYLTENDSHIYDTGWLSKNISYLKETLSVKYIQRKLKLAADKLKTEPEAEIANQVVNDSISRSDVIEIRIDDLIEGLPKPSADTSWDG